MTRYSICSILIRPPFRKDDIVKYSQSNSYYYLKRPTTCKLVAVLKHTWGTPLYVIWHFLIKMFLVYIWIALKMKANTHLYFFCGSCALFMGSTSTFFSSKNNYKTRSHDTTHIFKIYFVIVFSVFINKQYLNRPSVLYNYVILLLLY